VARALSHGHDDNSQMSARRHPGMNAEIAPHSSFVVLEEVLDGNFRNQQGLARLD